MKKIGIITMTGNSNFGNKLQNYALHYKISNLGFEVYTIWEKNIVNNFISILKRNLIRLFPFINKRKLKTYQREKKFKKFDKEYLKRFYIKKTELKKINSTFDNFVIGSDQIWNPNAIDNYLGLSVFDTNVSLLSYAASLGVSEVDEQYKKKVQKLFTYENIPYISIREEVGANIISNITNRNDISVNVDPTMLLTADEWDKISKKPKMLNTDKYVFNYFLGDLSDECKKEIERVAKENDCEVINILDKNSPFYACGPSEFLYLEKNAFLICTDSFHSSVFAILFNRPFIIFDRKQKGLENMNSRLENLISKFKLKNRKYEGKIISENLKHDYKEAYKILEIERLKSKDFLEKALNIK